MAVNSLFVRLRSRKVGGASTAENILLGQSIAMPQGTASNVVAVLLGGTGVSTAQQSFPTKAQSCLLTGQVRTMNAGTVTYVQEGGGGLPAWVQVPSQVDEENMYVNVLGWTGSTAAKKAPGVTPVSPMTTGGFPLIPTISASTNFGTGSPSGTLHNVTEADDLWNHYTMYKRTGEQRYLNWAQGWRDYYVDGSYESDLSTCGPAGTWTHVYGAGLVMWAMERNDVAARNKALALAALMEAQTISQVVPGTTNMSFNESRRYGRRTIFYCWISMLDPIARWIDIRNTCLDAWVQSPGWHDTTHPVSPTLIGGNHYSARSQFASGSANLGETQYDLGYRVNHSFEYAIHTEALWLGYKLTGRTDIRDMLVQIARHHLYYAWDPTHANPTVGGRWGHGPGGVRWHEFQDDFTSWTNTGETGLGPPDTINTNPNVIPASNYEASLVNSLVIGYRLTGETAFLTRAQEHWRQATCYPSQSSGLTKLADDQVHLYADTLLTETHFFNFNKGMLQYASQLMENGGVPALDASTEWQPEYPVPTSPGEVVQIAGQEAILGMTGNSTDPTWGGGSQWETNVFYDVRPSEVGSTRAGSQMLTGDSVSAYIRNFSQGGAIVTAGSGGHHGTINFGAGVFDFEDGRWKRIWTTAGNPGVDNITTANSDVRTGTKIHNCTNFEPDIYEAYVHGGGMCWHVADWPATSTLAPRVANPWEQTWEMSRITEPTTYNATTNIHGWDYPGQWNGAHQIAYPGRFDKTGYIMPCPRFTPTPAGTLAPTQSELPAPAHIWNMYFEMTPDDGGGPNGSIVCGRHLYAGDNGVTSTYVSHRFDLNTGIWHQYSTNSSERPSGQVTSSPDAEGSVAGCFDPVKGRYFIIGQRQLSKEQGRLLYMNVADRTWRNVNPGTAASAITNAPRTQAIQCDPDRRLLVMTIGNGSNNANTHARFRVLNLAPFDSQTILTGTMGGFVTVPLTAAAGFSINPNINLYNASTDPYPGTGFGITGKYNHYFNNENYPWEYYPPNGKYYRFCPRPMHMSGAAGSTPIAGMPPPFPTMAQYYANTAEGRALRVTTLMQRITPPAINAAAHAADPNYYLTQPWVYDEITISPVPRGSYFQFGEAVGEQSFKYIPTLQCFAWLPCQTMGNDSAGVSSRWGVYLIKPY